MRESMKTRVMRWAYNWFPAYRRTGARIIFISADFDEVRIELPLNWKTRNIVGTIFSGSMYGAVEPIYMAMLLRLLGPEYVVWDKAATAQFLRPGTSTLYACFTLDKQELDVIRKSLVHMPKLDRIYHVNLVDADGVVHATFEKTIYIRRKTYTDFIPSGVPPRSGNELNISIRPMGLRRVPARIDGDPIDYEVKGL